jgi:hypothetical protein
MKNWKQNVLIGMFVIIVLSFGFVGCKEPDRICECDPKEHYLPCKCEFARTDKCTCTVIPLGYIEELNSSRVTTGVKIPIWLKNDDAVSHDEISYNTRESILPKIKRYGISLSDEIYERLLGKITEIHIVEGRPYIGSNGYRNSNVIGDLTSFSGILEIGIYNNDPLREFIELGFLLNLSLTLDNGSTIPIYKTHEAVYISAHYIQAEGYIGERIQDGYNATFANKVNITSSKISAIHIVYDYKATCVSDGNGKFIISLPHNFTSDEIKTTFENFGGNELKDS